MSHVPRGCASGRGNTSSRTPLIIFVFGEFGASVHHKLLHKVLPVSVEPDSAFGSAEAVSQIGIIDHQV